MEGKRLTVSQEEDHLIKDKDRSRRIREKRRELDLTILPLYTSPLTSLETGEDPKMEPIKDIQMGPIESKTQATIADETQVVVENGTLVTRSGTETFAMSQELRRKQGKEVANPGKTAARVL